jgi:hypothetical protein
VTVTVDGSALSPGSVSSSGWELLLPLPDAVVGKPEMRVAIEANRTAKPAADPRELGLAFGEIAVKQSSVIGDLGGRRCALRCAC